MKAIGALLSVVLVVAVVLIAWTSLSARSQSTVYVSSPARSFVAPTNPGVAGNSDIRSPATSAVVATPGATPVARVPNDAIPRTEQLAKGVTLITPKYTVIAGDVVVDGSPLYANDGSIGLVTVLDVQAEVKAPYGASYTAMPDRPSAIAKARSIAAEMHGTGCKGQKGCVSVRIVSFPSRETVTA